jgi:ACS family glucarate transporter-like MFS transporter
VRRRIVSGLGAPSGAMGGRPTRVRYAVLVWLCSLSFLTYLDRICIMRVQGEIERDLELGKLTAADEEELRREGKATDREAREKKSRDRAAQRMSWIFSAFLIGYCIFEVPGGWLGDRWGARLVICRIVIWWSLFTALTGSVRAVVGWFTSSPEPWMLTGAMVLVRFLFGAGEAGAYPNISRALGRWFPFQQRGVAQGAIWLSSRIGGAVAPATIGLLMAVSGGWEAAFWVLGVAGIIWAIVFTLWFRNRPEEMPSANALECRLIRGDVAAGSIYDDHHQAGMPWLRLLSPNLVAVYLAAASVSFCWYFNITFLPRYLKDRHALDYGDSELLSGLPLLAGGVACLLGGALSDYLVRRLGSKRWGRSLPGFLGFLLAGATALLIPGLEGYGVAVATLCTVCFFQDLAVPCIWSLPADIGGRYAGTVGGFMNSVGAIGGALSAPFVAHLQGGEGGWDTVFYVFAAVYGFGALLWLVIDAGRGMITEPGRNP